MDLTKDNESLNEQTKRKTAETIRKKYGDDYYERIGALGGKKSIGGGFSAATPEQRREWGKLGGQRSRRTKR